MPGASTKSRPKPDWLLDCRLNMELQMLALNLTEKERLVLEIILRVDLDALGLDRKDQPAARSVLKKLKDFKKKE